MTRFPFRHMLTSFFIYRLLCDVDSFVTLLFYVSFIYKCEIESFDISTDIFFLLVQNDTCIQTYIYKSNFFSPDLSCAFRFWFCRFHRKVPFLMSLHYMLALTDILLHVVLKSCKVQVKKENVYSSDYEIYHLNFIILRCSTWHY